MARPELNEYEERNRRVWEQKSGSYQAEHGEALIDRGGLVWGVWRRPESELQVLGHVAGCDILELGCGGAQWSIALHKLGANPTGLDLSAAQLEHARALMDAAGVEFPLVCASAEAVPFPDASFDIVFCDWGAMTFADPYETVPEVARLLRPGGLFAFSAGTPIVDITWPGETAHPSEQLLVGYWDLHRIDDDEGMTSFQLPYGEWIRLFVANGLAIETLLELRPPVGATSTFRDAADHAWARRWPMEHIWRLRRQADTPPS
jgi:SAM-dependent methyltransferase